MKRLEPITVTELEAKYNELTATKEHLQLQLNGIMNQLFILNQLLSPPEPEPEPEPERPPCPPGTI